MRMMIGGRRVTVDLGHAAFATGLAGFCTWYLFDARSASTDIQNLLLIEPLAIAAVLIYLGVLWSTVRVDDTPVRPGPPNQQLAIRIGGSMLLLVLYVLIADLAGFDVATFLYVLAQLLLLGERRAAVLVLLPLCFTLVVIYAFRTILANPLPLAWDLFG